MLLLRVVAGSRLHGFATPTSDYDTLEVHTVIPHSPKKGGVTVIDKEAGTDTYYATLGHFMELASVGAHQFLDAMFASEASVDVDEIGALRDGFRPSMAAAGRLRDTVFQTAHLAYKLGGDSKKLRHAFRFAVNYRELVTTGRYTPELSDADKSYIMDCVAISDRKAVFEELVRITTF